MSNAVMRKKINALEAEVKILKAATFGRPSFTVDEKNWKKVRLASKKVRARLFKAQYA